jgi:hypothetical protein
MTPHCTCPPTRQPPCVWCTQRMARNEAHADAFITALHRAYPDAVDGIDVEAIMQEHRRQTAEERAPEDPPHPDQLPLFLEG